MLGRETWYEIGESIKKEFAARKTENLQSY
jgi:hypothetical protein